jgi:hypothetical protein
MSPHSKNIKPFPQAALRRENNIKMDFQEMRLQDLD